MSSVSRRVRQKVIAAAAVAVLLAGGAFAAVSATGQSNSRATATARRGVHVRELATAAAYLGLSRAQLGSALAGGKTLAQIADSSANKSEAGLIAALLAAKQRKLDSASAAGRLTRAQRAKRQARLQWRIARLVRHSFPGARSRG
jgi:hypothetical protein